MNIQPASSSFAAGLAGTGRAAAKSADADNSAASVAAQQRAEKPGGIENGILEVERDAAAGDAEADGRQLYEQRDGNPKDAPESDEEPQRRAASIEKTGLHLDLDA